MKRNPLRCLSVLSLLLFGASATWAAGPAPELPVQRVVSFARAAFVDLAGGEAKALSERGTLAPTVETLPAAGRVDGAQR